MAKTLQSTVTLSIQYTYTKSDNLGNAVETATQSNSSAYTTGDVANRVEIVYRAEVTVGAGGNVDVDIFGSVTDIFGDSVTMEVVRAMLIRNTAATAGLFLNVGPKSVANGFKEPWGDDADGFTRVGPSGAIGFDSPVDGYNVEPTEQIIRFHNPGGTALVAELTIIGTSGDLEESSNSSSSSSSSSSVALSSSSSSSLSSDSS